MIACFYYNLSIFLAVALNVIKSPACAFYKHFFFSFLKDTFIFLWIYILYLTQTNTNIVLHSHSHMLQLQIILSILFHKMITNIICLIKLIIGLLIDLVMKPSLKKYEVKYVLYVPKVSGEFFKYIFRYLSQHLIWKMVDDFWP